MSTVRLPVYVQFGPSLGGQAANVYYQVFDANNTSVINRNNNGVVEKKDYSNGAAGAYKITIVADLAWAFPLSVEWTVSGTAGAGVFANSVIGWDLVLIRGQGVLLDLTQPIPDSKAATLGGALAGLWALAWGKVVKNLTTKTLGLFGPGNTSTTPSGSFQLDDVVNPSERLPV